jgi:hypothetical protein
MVRAEDPAVILMSEEDTERLKVWSWWRRGRVEVISSILAMGLYPLASLLPRKSHAGATARKAS